VRFILIFLGVLFTTLGLAHPENLADISRSIGSPDELVQWLSSNLKTSITIPDEPHTAQEVLNRGGGDCDDLARVASGVLDNLGIENQILAVKFQGTKIKHALCIFKNENGSYDLISSKSLFKTGKRTVKEAIEKIYPDTEKIIDYEEMMKQQFINREYNWASLR